MESRFLVKEEGYANMEIYEILAMPILHLCQIESKKVQITFTIQMRRIDNVDLLLQRYSLGKRTRNVGTTCFRKHRLST